MSSVLHGKHLSHGTKNSVCLYSTENQGVGLSSNGSIGNTEGLGTLLWCYNAALSGAEAFWGQTHY